MKKIPLYLTVFSLSLAACSHKESTGSDSTIVETEILKDTLVPSSDTTATEVEKDSVVTPETEVYSDALILNAKGKVEQLVETFYTSSGEKHGSNTYLFDSKGNLMSVNGYKVKIRRDKEGRIKNLRYEEDVFEEDGEFGYMDFTYYYDKKGLVEKYDEDTGYSSGSYKNYHDKTGRVIKRRYDDVMGGGETMKFSYPSSETDQNGNWTKCTRTADGTATVIRRKIIYQ
ncbi:MAG: hypothetical protein K2N05_04870 [Muribaculaceae bacterium]|nr:hypothetical protein [Muribaculaceae bacterium]